MAHIFVGMSGGIDSSAAVKLLVDQGHQVTGLTYTGLAETGSKKCCSLEEIQNARRVAKALGIPHQILDLKSSFESHVVKPFVQSYRLGETPNPCMLCNRHIKYGALLEHVLSQGGDAFATGHYVRLAQNPWRLQRGVDSAKDQSYFLAYIDPAVLPYLCFPLGEFTKSETRAFIQSSDLPIRHDASESQDICFVPKDYRTFLQAQGVQAPSGKIVQNGEVLGTHQGIPFYTMGQRRGLGVSTGTPAYIRSLDRETQTIEIGSKPQSHTFWLRDWNPFFALENDIEQCTFQVQTRYRGPLSQAQVSQDGHRIRVQLAEAQNIVSKGQFAVLYLGMDVYASGVIDEVVLLDPPA